MLQETRTERPILASLAGPNLACDILVSKFDDHLPLYRQTRSSSVWARHPKSRGRLEGGRLY